MQGVFYSEAEVPTADEETIEKLRSYLATNNQNMGRLCLHRSEKQILMSMLIVVINKHIYPIHRHTWKDETYTILKGRCVYNEYNEHREKTYSQVLTEKSVLMNCGKKFHTIEPLTDVLSFIEHTIGPFKAKKLEIL